MPGSGRAIRQHRASGRTRRPGAVGVNLFVLPFGTALAIYTFWVLLHNEARALFVAPESSDPADRAVGS